MTQTLAWKKLAVTIHIGFMASLLVYGVVVWLVIPRIEPSLSQAAAGTLSNNVRYVFFGIAVLVVLALRRLPRLLGPKKDEPEEVNSARRLRASILTSALCEVPAVLGLAMVFLTGSQRDFLYLTGISIVFFLIYFPRESMWEEA
jgi:cytochrome b561